MIIKLTAWLRKLSSAFKHPRHPMQLQPVKVKALHHASLKGHSSNK